MVFLCFAFRPPYPHDSQDLSGLLIAALLRWGMAEELHLHLVSDATGETIHALARACLVQFDGVVVKEHLWSMIRSKRQLQMVEAALDQNPGLVLYTFVDEDLREALGEFCAAHHHPCLAVMDPVLQKLAVFLGRAPAQQPGKQHRLDDAYFARIDAMDYALAADDGQRQKNLDDADVVVLGVSRTSKTPTCLYLANRGLRAANIPLVSGQDLLPDLLALRRPFLVGLTKDPDRLVEIRRQRLKHIGAVDMPSYADPEAVRAELLAARRLFARLDCPVIDVTDRSIEETAAEIMTLLALRRERAS